MTVEQYIQRVSEIVFPDRQAEEVPQIPIEVEALATLLDVKQLPVGLAILVCGPPDNGSILLALHLAGKYMKAGFDGYVIDAEGQLLPPWTEGDDDPFSPHLHRMAGAPIKHVPPDPRENKGPKRGERLEWAVARIFNLQSRSAIVLNTINGMPTPETYLDVERGTEETEELINSIAADRTARYLGAAVNTLPVHDKVLIMVAHSSAGKPTGPRGRFKDHVASVTLWASWDEDGLLTVECLHNRLGKAGRALRVPVDEEDRIDWSGAVRLEAQ